MRFVRTNRNARNKVLRDSGFFDVEEPSLISLTLGRISHQVPGRRTAEGAARLSGQRLVRRLRLRRGPVRRRSEQTAARVRRPFVPGQLLVRGPQRGRLGIALAARGAHHPLSVSLLDPARQQRHRRQQLAFVCFASAQTFRATRR